VLVSEKMGGPECGVPTGQPRRRGPLLHSLKLGANLSPKQPSFPDSSIVAYECTTELSAYNHLKIAIVFVGDDETITVQRPNCFQRNCAGSYKCIDMISNWEEVEADL
jgi:hypothetical protein